MSRPLGRLIPTDWDHVSSYPLTATVLPDSPTAVVLGVNWYDSFDFPEKRSDGRWWIKETNPGPIRGGHAICTKPAGLVDPLGWWDFYNQPGSDCVGFSVSRLSSLHNRTRYGGTWLYGEAQKIDEWPGENYDGTSVRAGFEIVRTRGHRRLINGVLKPELLGDGISAYRWMTSADEVLSVLKMPLAYSLEAVPMLQSWGRTYPHITWLSANWLDRLLGEDGEAGTVTDR